MQGEDRFAPVVNAVIHAVAGAHEYSIRAGIVDDARTRPDRVPGRSTDRRHAIGEMLEMNGLIAAGGVEDFLRTRGEIDRGHVTLIVAVVARIAAVHDVKIADAVRGRDCQRRRTLFVEALESRQLRPAASDDFGAVADLVLVDVSVETVAINIIATRIDRRRRCGVARATRTVDLAGTRSVLVAPDLRAVLRVQRDDATVPRRH